MNRWMTLLLLSASLSACAPSVRDLVARRHYREAICAENDARSPSVRRVVREATTRDLGLTVHAQLVHAPLLAELQRARGTRSTIAMVRFDLQSNDLPLEETTIRASFGSQRSGGSTDDYRGYGVRTATLAALTTTTREAIPRDRHGRTYLTFDNLLRGTAALLTGGLSLTVAPFESAPYTISPSVEEIRRAAPRAAELESYVHSMGCVRLVPVGSRCRWYAIVDEQPDAEFVVRLEVAHRASAPQRGGSACYFSDEMRVSLGRVGELERTLRAQFGTRAIALDHVEHSHQDDR